MIPDVDRVQRLLARKAELLGFSLATSEAVIGGMEMSKLGVKDVALSLGLFGAVTFVLCVGWGLLLPRFHATPLLEMMLPGFRWLTPASFVLGLIESFAFGVYAGAIFTLIYNWVARRAGPA